MNRQERIARREQRASLKTAATEWKTYNLPTAEHLNAFKKKLRDSKISFHVSSEMGPIRKVVVENKKDHQKADSIYQEL